MSFASEFRKKYFLDPLTIAKPDADVEPEQAAPGTQQGDGDGEGAATGRANDSAVSEEADGPEPAEQPAAPDSVSATEPALQSETQDTGTALVPVAHDPEQLYSHEVIAPRPEVGPMETRANVHRALAAMLIAAGLLAVLHSGALATYARGLPYGKVYERMIMAAEVWHGYMEQAGVSAVMTTARDWVTAVRESHWADIAGLVGFEAAPDLEEAAGPSGEGTDVSSEASAPDAEAEAIEDAPPQPEPGPTDRGLPTPTE